LKASFAKLLPSVKIVIIRADKGFYNHETVEYLESENALFVIVAKLTAPVKRRISTLFYQVHSSGLETAEFMYQPTRWKKEYRIFILHDEFLLNIRVILFWIASYQRIPNDEK